MTDRFPLRLLLVDSHLGKGVTNHLRKVIGFFLIIAGLPFIFYLQIEKFMYDREQQQLIESFEQLGTLDFIEEIEANNESAITVSNNKGESQSKETNEMLTEARGMIQINSIDLEMVIFNSTTSYNLSKGVGMIEPKKEIGLNNIGLAAHRALTKGKQFNRLDEVREGDAINVQTQDRSFEFIVTRRFVVHKSDVSVLEDQEEPLVTLVTCTPLGRPNPPDRLIVQAVLKE